MAAIAQASVHDAIPKKWKAPAKVLVLTSAQIEITEQTATELVVKLASGKLSSIEVTEAFCARAAIAHQLVSKYV